MLVYGIRCNLSDVDSQLVAAAGAEYNEKHGLLLFPAYAKPGYFENNRTNLNRRFIETIQRVLEAKDKAHVIDLEQPYISEEEDAIVKAVRGVTNWYYLP
jgi:glycerol kinase